MKIFVYQRGQRQSVQRISASCCRDGFLVSIDFAFGRAPFLPGFFFKAVDGNVSCGGGQVLLEFRGRAFAGVFLDVHKGVIYTLLRVKIVSKYVVGNRVQISGIFPLHLRNCPFVPLSEQSEYLAVGQQLALPSRIFSEWPSAVPFYTN